MAWTRTVRLLVKPRDEDVLSMALTRPLKRLFLVRDAVACNDPASAHNSVVWPQRPYAAFVWFFCPFTTDVNSPTRIHVCCSQLKCLAEAVLLDYVCVFTRKQWILESIDFFWKLWEFLNRYVYIYMYIYIYIYIISIFSIQELPKFPEEKAMLSYIHCFRVKTQT